MIDTLLLPVASTRVEASAKRKAPRVSILAYNGGIINVGGYGPVVIRLAGVELPPTVPLLADHENRLNAVIGSGRPEVCDGKLLIEGALANVDAAKQVIELARGGVDLQASVGVHPLEMKYVAGGESLTVNGRTITIPKDGVTLVARSELKEVSILPIGADADSTVEIAARAAGKKGAAVMEGEGTTTVVAGDNVAAERERVNKILALTENHSIIRASAVADGWSLEKTQIAVLERERDDAKLAALRAGRPRINNLQTSGPTSGASDKDTLTAAAMHLMGASGAAETELGADVAQRGEDLCCRSALDLCARALAIDHIDVPRGRNELIKAAFSTASLPAALGASAEKLALNSYRETPASWRSIARIETVRNFREHTMIRSVFGGEYQPLGPDGELKHGTLAEETFTVQAETQGQLLSVTRAHFIDDNLSFLDGISRALGRAAARRVSDEVFKTLLLNKEPDGSTSFFTTARGNLVEGTDGALGISALADACAKMLARVDSEGRPIDLQGRVLCVPPELDRVGREMLTSETIARYVSSSANARPQGNPFGDGRLALSTEPRLSNATFTGSSATAWYLFSAPSDGAIVVAFLDGKQGPTIEQVDLPGDVLGLAWRGYIDFGTSLADHRACHRCTGVAP